VGDNKSRAYSLAGEISISMVVAPKSLDQFEKLKRKAIEAISKTTDTYIKNWTMFVIGSEEILRGRIRHARDAATELMRVGRILNDPRSTGQGLNLLAWMSLVSDAYAEALEYSEQAWPSPSLPTNETVPRAPRDVLLSYFDAPKTGPLCWRSITGAVQLMATFIRSLRARG
jgi:hypothetical protein